MDGNKRSGHGRVAGKKQGSAFFNDSGELVTYGIDAQIWPVVTYSHDYRGLLVFSCKKYVRLF